MAGLVILANEHDCQLRQSLNFARQWAKKNITIPCEFISFERYGRISHEDFFRLVENAIYLHRTSEIMFCIENGPDLLRDCRFTYDYWSPWGRGVEFPRAFLDLYRRYPESSYVTTARVPKRIQRYNPLKAPGYGPSFPELSYPEEPEYVRLNSYYPEWVHVSSASFYSNVSVNSNGKTILTLEPIKNRYDTHRAVSMML